MYSDSHPLVASLRSLGPEQLEQMGWIKSKWGASENNRRAKYYSITRGGLKQLTAEEESWRRTSEVMLRFLAPAEEK